MSRQIQFQGQVCASPSAATILIDGVQVFSGQVGTGEPLNADLTITTITLADAANTAANVNVSVSVTSGIIKVGSMVSDLGPWLSWGGNASPLNADEKATIGLICDATATFYGAGVERSNILINGVAPEYPATPVGFDPGPVNAPDWNGWRFEVSAGETLTCTVNIPPIAQLYFNN